MATPKYHTTSPDLWRRLKPEAKRMRRIPTPAEAAMWQRLRRKALGAHFRRQHPVGRYIPDFVCLEKQIVVEVDGPIHDRQKDRDAARDAYLVQLGFRVLRFTNDQVLNNPHRVLDKISSELAATARQTDEEGRSPG